MRTTIDKKLAKRQTIQGIVILVALLIACLCGEIKRLRAEASKGGLLSPLAESTTEYNVIFVDKPLVATVHAQNIPEPTPQPEFDLPQILDGIHALESSRGAANFEGSLQRHCEHLGMWNELGWGGMEKMLCFSSRERGLKIVGEWITKTYKKTGDLAVTLCSYNLGPNDERAKAGNCKYYDDYLKVTIP